MEFEQIDSIKIPGFVGKDQAEYNILRNYIASLPIAISDGKVHIEILYRAKDVNNSKVVFIRPNDKPFYSVYVKTKELGNKKFEFTHYADNTLNFKFENDEIIVYPPSNLDKEKRLEANISELEQKIVELSKH